MNHDTDDLAPATADRLRRGLALLADEAHTAAGPAKRARWQPAIAIAAAAAVVAIAVGVGTQLLADDSGESSLANQAPAATTPGPSSPGADAPIAMGISYDLHRLVAESPRVVVGTITDVKRGSLGGDGGMDYVIGIVKVEEMLRGPATGEIAAFDYDYGTAITSGPAMGAALVPGSRVLLFLADATGTVHESVKPQHWQVTGGAQGLYVMKGGEPNAPFTLADVRAEIARADG